MKSLDEAVNAFINTPDGLEHSLNLDNLAQAFQRNPIMHDYFRQLVMSFADRRMSFVQCGMSIALTAACVGVRLGQEMISRVEGKIDGRPVAGLLDEAMRHIVSPTEDGPDGVKRALVDIDVSSVKDSSLATDFLVKLAATIFPNDTPAGFEEKIVDLSLMSMAAGLSAGIRIAGGGGSVQ